MTFDFEVVLRHFISEPFMCSAYCSPLCDPGEVTTHSVRSFALKDASFREVATKLYQMVLHWRTTEIPSQL